MTVDRDQAGQNQLDGTGLGDILIGRAAANDVILGNEGNDVLIGDSGNDTLNGGTGKDLLVGGAGADIYDFNATTESGNTIPTADIITGWEVADVIDVNSIDANINSSGNQNFTFGGVDFERRRQRDQRVPKWCGYGRPPRHQRCCRRGDDVCVDGYHRRQPDSS